MTTVESQPDVMFSHQLKYKSIDEANCKYRYMRIPLRNSNGTNLTLGPSDTRLLEFLLPNSVYNLAQSYLSYDITLAGEALKSCWMPEDCPEIITSAYFGNASDVAPCNLANANRYVKVARKIKTKMEDFLTYDKINVLYPSNRIANTTSTYGASATKDIVVSASGTSVAAGELVKFEDLSTFVFTPNYYPVNTQNKDGVIARGVLNLIEPTYLNTPVITNATAGNNTAIRNRLMPLKAFVDTIFEVDKDIFVPSETLIRFNAGPPIQSLFTSGSHKDPTLTPLAPLGDVTLSNIYIYLAVETNEQVANAVRNLVRTKGLRMNIPYTWGFKTSSSTGATNINIPLSKQYGHTLKHILHTCFNATESANTCLDHGNFNGVKLNLWNTFLGNLQRQDQPIDCAFMAPNFMDYKEVQRHTEGSVISNRAVYAQNWFILEKMYEENKESSIADANRIDGYSMAEPVLWQLQGTTYMNLVHYTWATFNRELLIDNEGLHLF